MGHQTRAWPRSLHKTRLFRWLSPYFSRPFLPHSASLSNDVRFIKSDFIRPKTCLCIKLLNFCWTWHINFEVGLMNEKLWILAGRDSALLFYLYLKGGSYPATCTVRSEVGHAFNWGWELRTYWGSRRGLESQHKTSWDEELGVGGMDISSLPRVFGVVEIEHWEHWTHSWVWASASFSCYAMDIMR